MSPKHWLYTVPLRLRSIFQRRQVDSELDEELQYHLDMKIEENEAKGMNRDEARRSSLLALGGLDQRKEECRDARGLYWLDQLRQDLLYASRMLSRNPFSALITIILIAATIGMLCAAYAVMDAVLLRTLPVPHPEQLVVINPMTSGVDSSIYEVLALQRQNISNIFGMKTLVAYGNAGNNDRQLSICVIKGDYFGTAGAIPEIGSFLKADEQDTVAVISDHLWHREFAGSRDILGKRIKLGSQEFTIIGVARPDLILMEEPYSEWEVIVPCDTFARSQGNEHWSPLQVIARMKNGKRASEYEAQLNTLWPALLRATVPPRMTLDQWREISGARAQVIPIPRGINYILILNQSIPTAIHITFGLSLLIFFSGCLALVLLAIARGIKNRQQAAILSAIGGGRWRVHRPLFLETLVLSVLGCGLGLVIAFWWSSLGASFLPSDMGINWRVRIDRQVITLASFMTFLIVAVISLVTALSSRDSSGRIMHTSDAVSQPSVRMRTSLLAIQLAVSVLLVHYALFFAAAFSTLIHIPVGFDPENLHVYTLLTKPPGRKIPDNYFPRLIDQIKQMPGVESTAVTTGRAPADWPVEYKQPIRTEEGREAQATVVPVSPGYFRTLNLPLLLGKDFSWKDRNTAIANETLLKKLYPDQDLEKHTIYYGKSGVPLRIIGVSDKMTYFGPRFGNSSMLFVPCADDLETSHSGVSIMIRSKRSLEEVRQELQTLLNPLGAYYVFRSVDQQTYLSDSMRQERMLATIAGIFGILIVLLAGVELCAFCNYLLTMRTKELAIRASLGAGPVRIAAALLHETAKALAIGSIIGIALTFAGQRVLSGVMEKVNPPSASQIIEALLIIAAVTFGALLLPIIRALRMSIVDALRVE